MAEPAGHEPRGLLFAAVVSRMVWLRHVAVLHGPSPATTGEPDGPGSTTTAMLWAWSRLLGDLHRLAEEVLAPALREPGRLHRRETAIVRGRPRGAVHWGRTAQLEFDRVASGGLRYVCTVAERSVLAPENLLLLGTLEELSARGRLLADDAEADALLGAARSEPARQVQTLLRTLADEPWAARCREALAELRHDPGAMVALEDAVDQRTRGRPCAAPDWAPTLLELRRAKTAIPTRAALAAIDAATLWQHFAHLELLCTLRGRGWLRQHEQGYVGDGLTLQPIAGTPAWVLEQPGHEAVGVLAPTMLDWEAIRREALYWSWTALQRGADIDRWLIVHRVDHQGFVRRREPMRLCYWPLDARHGLGSSLGSALAALAAE